MGLGALTPLLLGFISQSAAIASWMHKFPMDHWSWTKLRLVSIRMGDHLGIVVLLAFPGRTLSLGEVMEGVVCLRMEGKIPVKPLTLVHYHIFSLSLSFSLSFFGSQGRLYFPLSLSHPEIIQGPPSQNNETSLYQFPISYPCLLTIILRFYFICQKK
jgi:hypothetical protein